MTPTDSTEKPPDAAAGPASRGTGERRPGGESGPRYYVTYAFYRIENEFRRLDPGRRAAATAEFQAHLEEWSRKIQLHAYSTAGLRPDTDFLIWRISPNLDELREAAAAARRTDFGAYLETPHSYLAMTRRSIYVDKHQHPGQEGTRLYIKPTESKYLFIYPFVKTHEWYQLPMADRQKMMDEHIAVGHKFPGVRINTTYSFGLDDQEFVVAFESDNPAEFLDLVMDLRTSRARPYTLRDTPIFTCIRRTFAELCAEF